MGDFGWWNMENRECRKAMAEGGMRKYDCGRRKGECGKRKDECGMRRMLKGEGGIKRSPICNPRYPIRNLQSPFHFY